MGDEITIKFELTGPRAFNYELTNETTHGSITHKIITITQNTANAITKVYDGTNDYTGPFLKDAHYIMSDTVPGETIYWTVGQKKYNSIYVTTATKITVTFTLTSAAVNSNYKLAAASGTPASSISVEFAAKITERVDPLKIEIVPSTSARKICEYDLQVGAPVASFENYEIVSFTISGNVDATIPSGVNLIKSFKLYKLSRTAFEGAVAVNFGNTQWWYDPDQELAEGSEGFIAEPDSLYYIVPNAEYQATNPDDDPASQRALESVQVISTPSFIEIGTP